MTRTKAPTDAVDHSVHIAKLLAQSKTPVTITMKEGGPVAARPVAPPRGRRGQPRPAPTDKTQETATEGGTGATESATAAESPPDAGRAQNPGLEPRPAVHRHRAPRSAAGVAAGRPSGWRAKRGAVDGQHAKADRRAKAVDH